MTIPAPFTSHFMLLDVKTGRQALARKIKAGGKVKVWVTATIDGAQGVGNDDGTSIEFSAYVENVKVRFGEQL